MSGHTPGPWIWADGFNGLYGAGPDNAVLEFAPYEGMWLSFKRQEANAKLIATAPEFASVCEAVLALDAATDIFAGNEHVRDALRCVLARAGVR